MSSTAPWLALAIDWQDSSMFEPLPEHGVSDPATMGERLAWVMLLCHAKTKGRGGKVSLRKNAFARDYNLSMRAVEGMLSRAQKCAAIELNGEFVTVCNWRTYQHRAWSSGKSDSPEITETVPNGSTHHQAPTTHHTSPSTTKNTRASPKAFKPPTVEEVRAYCQERGNSIDAEYFVNHYEANGWVQNRGKPIVDWRAAVRTWEQNQPLFGANKHGNNGNTGSGKKPARATF